MGNVFEGDLLKNKRYMIHRLADCMNQNVPESTKIWQFCVVFPKCKIGENCNICSHCLIENDVEIGNNVTIKCGVQVWDGITLEDNVMVGSNVTFTNDMFPRSKNKDWTLLKPRVCKGATIGAGSVVTKDVPAGELWMGNPARFYREVDF